MRGLFFARILSWDFRESYFLREFGPMNFSGTLLVAARAARAAVLGSHMLLYQNKSAQNLRESAPARFEEFFWLRLFFFRGFLPLNFPWTYCLRDFSLAINL